MNNTGYVRQLASYYYDELTVRQNLLFSMNLQAMRGMSLTQKLERVEQVIREVRNYMHSNSVSIPKAKVHNYIEPSTL